VWSSIKVYLQSQLIVNNKKLTAIQTHTQTSKQQHRERQARGEGGKTVAVDREIGKNVSPAGCELEWRGGVCSDREIREIRLCRLYLLRLMPKNFATVQLPGVETVREMSERKESGIGQVRNERVCQTEEADMENIPQPN
jgi:hypothetical protein